MSLHEKKKICKLIDELSLFLLRDDKKNMNISLSYKDEETKIEIIVDKLSEKVKKYMLESINLKREFEVEEYGWELMGESDKSNDLEMVGLLIDYLEIIDMGEQDKLIFVRTKRKIK